MGPAGAGKGTLADMIKNEFRLAHIATGNMFRTEIAEKSDLGVAAKEYIDGGKLVPDELTIAMVMKRMSKDDCVNGYLLDGFPRTLKQAEALSAALAAKGEDIQMAINLCVDPEVLGKRIEGRRICTSCDAIYHMTNTPPQEEGICDRCGSRLVQRSDDTREQLAVRLKEYEEVTKPVLAYYQKLGIVIDIDASATPDEVWQEVEGHLAGLE